jgi:hypothetical protein
MRVGPPPVATRAWRVSTTRNHLLTTVGVLVACCTISHAQTFYKWTDEHGVVHLADEPAPDARNVEERQLPAPPPVPATPPAGDAGDAKAAPGETPAGDASSEKSEADSAPARVIMVSHQVIRNGPRSAHVIGEVKNVGGQNADAVEITLRTVDATQGTLCLNEQAAVTPSTLPPGESGNFDADIDSPCLAGDTPVDVTPVWK